MGSSPLTQGKLLVAVRACDHDGLIPAHAGKTTTSLSEVSGAMAHPRSRGENSTYSTVVGSMLGSSPLTRGKQASLSASVEACGLIPAHAGKTFGDDDARRGEPGSSPLTRGKPDQGTNPLSPGGLIPAHAGKTHGEPPCSSSCRAHPRSRGENDTRPAPARPSVGSSPLTRGKLHDPVLLDR